MTSSTEALTNHELNGWLAEHLFGWHHLRDIQGWIGGEAGLSVTNQRVPDYSSTGDGMLLVLEAIRERAWVVSIDEASVGPAGARTPENHRRLWDCTLKPFDDEDERYIVEMDESLPRAVALAAKSATEEPA